MAVVVDAPMNGSDDIRLEPVGARGRLDGFLFDDGRDLPWADLLLADLLGMIFRNPKVLRDTLIDKG